MNKTYLQKKEYNNKISRYKHYTRALKIFELQFGKKMKYKCVDDLPIQDYNYYRFLTRKLSNVERCLSLNNG